MKKIIYPSAALLTAFALLSVQTAKADTSQAPDQANEPAATVEEVVASPAPETSTENQGGVSDTSTVTDREAVPSARLIRAVAVTVWSLFWRVMTMVCSSGVSTSILPSRSKACELFRKLNSLRRDCTTGRSTSWAISSLL